MLIPRGLRRLCPSKIDGHQGRAALCALLMQSELHFGQPVRASLFLKSSQGQTHEENNAKFLHNQDPKGLIMFVTICRLYESYDDANLTIRDLKAAGVPLEDTGIVSNNSDNWYSPDSGKSGDSDLAAGSLDHDAKRRNDHDGRLEAAGVGAAIGATAGTAAGLLTLLAIPRRWSDRRLGVALAYSGRCRDWRGHWRNRRRTHPCGRKRGRCPGVCGGRTSWRNARHSPRSSSRCSPG